jgi:hypothetical protein
LAEVPYLFAEIRQPQSEYVMIPMHTSENRKYVPLGFFPAEAILHNSSTAVPDATQYHFGVLSSEMHMAWMRTVCGRLKGDYRYSNNLVYNNYPWPQEPTDAQKKRIEAAAHAVLDARAQYPNSTLADLYDPLTMPKPLLDAHRTLDAAVDACYRKAPFKSELERLEFLFAMYKELTRNLFTEGRRRRGRNAGNGSI